MVISPISIPMNKILPLMALGALTAPTWAQQTALTEDFDAGVVPPTGWAELNNGVTNGWEPDLGDPDPRLGALDGWILSRLQGLIATVGAFIVWFAWVQAEPVGTFVIDYATIALGEDSEIRTHLLQNAAQMRHVVMGVLLLVVLRFAPRGIIPETDRT